MRHLFPPVEKVSEPNISVTRQRWWDVCLKLKILTMNVISTSGPTREALTFEKLNRFPIGVPIAGGVMG